MMIFMFDPNQKLTVVIIYFSVSKAYPLLGVFLIMPANGFLKFECGVP